MPDQPPQHILILGSGVFALTTLLELLERPLFSRTTFTLVSPTLPLDASASPAATDDKSTFPAHLTSSHDTTRIIRTDYADPAYAALGAEAHAAWRDPAAGWGADGRYRESGLVLSADSATGGTGAEYIRKALANAKTLEREAGVAEADSKVRELQGAEAVQQAMKAGAQYAKGTGDSGYLNIGGGWADAGACTTYLQQRVLTHHEAAARLTVHRAAATRLSLSDDETPRITGAELDRAPHRLAADLTILATGAWTPTLLDTRGVASARAQSSAYIPLSDAEAAALAHVPVHINLASGCFFFPPTRTARRPGAEASPSSAGWELKVARHAFGYAPPSRRARPLRVDADGEPVHSVAGVRAPTFPEHMPPADEALLRAFVARALPALADVEHGPRAWAARMCYYLDTATGDWLVGRHPAFRSSLFVATGGSGHAFKFMPALGRRVVDVLDGTDARDGRGAWTRKWAWPVREAPLRRWESGEVWCHDGSRAGEPGLLLEEALRGVQKKVPDDPVPQPRPEEQDVRLPPPKSNL